MDAFCLTLLVKNKSYAGISSNVGQVLGFFVGSTIFIAFNDKNWLNTNIYKGKKILVVPWISHQNFLLVLGLFFIIFSILILIFVSEKIIQKRHINYLQILTYSKEILIKKEVYSALFIWATVNFLNIFVTSGVLTEMIREVKNC